MATNAPRCTTTTAIARRPTTVGRREPDRQDGRIDIWSYYDDSGIVTQEKMDGDFDGNADWVITTKNRRGPSPRSTPTPTATLICSSTTWKGSSSERNETPPTTAKWTTGSSTRTANSSRPAWIRTATEHRRQERAIISVRRSEML